MTFLTPSSLDAASAAAPQSWPATSAWMSPPIALAAVTALPTPSSRLVLSCFTISRTAIYSTPASFFSFATRSSTFSTFTPALRIGGSPTETTVSRGLTSTP